MGLLAVSNSSPSMGNTFGDFFKSTVPKRRQGLQRAKGGNIYSLLEF